MNQTPEQWRMDLGVTQSIVVLTQRSLVYFVAQFADLSKHATFASISRPFILLCAHSRPHLPSLVTSQLPYDPGKHHATACGQERH